jgi:hypothetical protein
MNPDEIIVKQNEKRSPALESSQDMQSGIDRNSSLWNFYLLPCLALSKAVIIRRVYEGGMTAGRKDRGRYGAQLIVLNND